ncbi:MAG TPA: hypothetical protein VGR53_03655 [Nitrososphaerales archaeon]|nr:hypothetical protein [Nitrososphaerales archaeon]
MMIAIECIELTLDEQIALASAVSEGLRGAAIALIQDSKIVIDLINVGRIDPLEVEGIVRQFVSRRKDAQHYSVERDGGYILVHSPDPLARSRGRKKSQLPGNLLQCPSCGFVTQYKELYNIHVRSHGIPFGF